MTKQPRRRKPAKKGAATPLLPFGRPKAKFDVLRHMPRFETVGQAHSENQVRSRSLREFEGKLKYGHYTRLATADDRDEVVALAERLADGNGAPGSLACARYMRRLRRRFAGELMRLHDLVDNDAVAFTLVNARWRTPACDLLKTDAAELKAALRSALNRAGADINRGAIVAALHGDFDRTSETFNIHFHGVAFGQARQWIESLRRVPSFQRSAAVYRPVVCQSLREPARQLTYLLKSYWSEQNRTADGQARRIGAAHRITEPWHALYITWLARQSLNDILLLHGARIHERRIAFTGTWAAPRDLKRKRKPRSPRAPPPRRSA